ncbi:hypothetical protein TrRE_jg7020, partial [Triparma retinervis]
MQQFGFIFNLDMIVPTSSADLSAWSAIADSGSYTVDLDEAHRGSRMSEPLEVCVGRVLGEREPALARRLGMTFFEERNRLVMDPAFLAGVQAAEGAGSWMSRLAQEGCPIACYSRLPRPVAAPLVKIAGVRTDLLVTPDDGWDTLEQVVLGGAMGIMRQPSKCLVFDESPRAAVKAHEAGMKFVGVLGTYPRYELGVADKTIAEWGEMKIRDVRGVFGEETELELEREVEDGMGGGGGG